MNRDRGVGNAFRSIRHTLTSPGPRFISVITFIFACGLAYEPLYHIVRGSLAYSIIPQDDFYYYYLVAKHLALDRFSSFDGIIPTNGYHPLWMLALAGMHFIARGNDRLCFILIEAAQILSAVITARLLTKLFGVLYGPAKWIPALSLLASLLLTVLIFLSMETVVAIPLYVLFLVVISRGCEFRSRTREAFLCGLVGSLLVLARLDAILAVGLTLLLFLYLRSSFKSLVAYAIGLLPIVVYLILNRAIFGAWLPVSAEVKALGSGIHVSLLPIEVIRTPRGFLYFILMVTGCVLSIRALTRSDPSSGLRLLIFLFPLFYVLLLMLRLSWPVYVWYFYPFPIAAAAGLLELRAMTSTKFQSRLDRAAPAGLLLIMICSIIILSRDIPGLTTNLNLDERTTRAQPNIYIHALGIKPFTDSHPGRYAMGDRAGLTAFITGQPILQVEGLAADPAMVDSVRACADLLAVLKKYGVHYYIVSYPLKEFHEQQNNWALYEPHRQQVLPWMPLMRGDFYAPEVFRFPLPVGVPLSNEDSGRWVTRILDISEAHEK